VSEGSLLLHALSAFVVGGGWVALVTWLGEVRGSSLGGLIAGLPSTAPLGFLFIGWNQSALIAADATTDFPLIFSMIGVFLLSYAILAKGGFWKAFVLSLVVWLAGTSWVVAFNVQDFYVSLVGCVAVSLVVYYVFSRRLKFEELPPSKPSGSLLRIALRFVIGGGIVSLAVLASQAAGPSIGAIPTAFPAISTSVVYMLYKSQGTEFSRAFTMPLMVTAMLTVVPYCIAVRVFYPTIGFLWGAGAAYLVAIPFAVLSYFVLNPARLPLRRSPVP
jgi:hypothetical protein